MHENHQGFKPGKWQDEINVRDFIQQNYKAYEGDDSFLAGATERTNEMMKKVNSLFKLERQYGGVLDIDTTTVSSRLSLNFSRKLAMMRTRIIGPTMRAIEAMTEPKRPAVL